MKTILSIDDEESILSVLKTTLGGRGYATMSTSDPLGAIALIRNNNVDMITLDVEMPDLDGLQLFAELKKADGSVIPVLFITGHPEAFSMKSPSLVELWQNEFADGNTDILYKPFDLSMLLDKVEALIGPPEDE